MCERYLNKFLQNQKQINQRPNYIKKSFDDNDNSFYSIASSNGQNEVYQQIPTKSSKQSFLKRSMQQKSINMNDNCKRNLSEKQKDRQKQDEQLLQKIKTLSESNIDRTTLREQFIKLYKDNVLLRLKIQILQETLQKCSATKRSENKSIYCPICQLKQSQTYFDIESNQLYIELKENYEEQVLQNLDLKHQNRIIQRQLEDIRSKYAQLSKQLSNTKNPSMSQYNPQAIQFNSQKLFSNQHSHNMSENSFLRAIEDISQINIEQVDQIKQKEEQSKLIEEINRRRRQQFQAKINQLFQNYGKL